MSDLKKKGRRIKYANKFEQGVVRRTKLPDAQQETLSFPINKFNLDVSRITAIDKSPRTPY